MIYLGPFVGAGTKADPCRPRGTGKQTGGSADYAVLDLRPDGGASPDGGGGTANRCVFWAPIVITDTLVTKLGDTINDAVSDLMKSRIRTALGLSTLDVLPTRLGDLLGNLIGVDRARWPVVRARQSDGLRQAFLGAEGEVWRLAPIGGGRDLYPEDLRRHGRLLATLDDGTTIWSYAGTRWAAWPDGHVTYLRVIAGGGPGILDTDAFTGTSGDLGTKWDTITGINSWTRVTDVAVPVDLTGDCIENNNSVAWPDDQYSEFKINTLTTAALEIGPGPGLRCATGAKTLYWFVCGTDAGNDSEIAKVVAGTYTPLAARDGNWTVGTDKARLDVQGSTLTAKKNGTALGADVTDTAIATGRAAIAYSSTAVAASLDDFEGGDFVAAGGGSGLLLGGSRNLLVVSAP